MLQCMLKMPLYRPKLMLKLGPPKAHNLIEELPKAFAKKLSKWESDIEPVIFSDKAYSVI